MTYLNDPIHTNPSLSKYPFDILAAHARLIRDATLDQVALCVGGDLDRDEDVGTGDDGLGLLGGLAPLSFLPLVLVSSLGVCRYMWVRGRVGRCEARR